MRSPTARALAVVVSVVGVALAATCAIDDPGGEASDHQCRPDVDVDVARQKLVGDSRLCGGCDPHCWLTTDTPNQGDLDTDPDVWGDSVAYDATKGGIVIVPPGVRVTSNYAWLANTAVSTVTKVHLQTYTAQGVYRVGLSSLGTGGNDPSRTTVDILGCAYVANRALGGGQGSVTKIAGELEDCHDLNANGVIDTSSGLGDIRGWPGAVNQDECVLWNRPIGPVGGMPRALAIDALGRVWVGLYDTQRFYVLDSVDGHVISSVNVGLRPYGAAIAPDGLLWTTTAGSALQSINTYTLVPSAADVGPLLTPPIHAYGIAVDSHSRVFLADVTDGGICRYDPSTGTFATVGNGGFRSGGVSVDEFDVVYTGDLTADRVTMYDADAMSVLGFFATGAWGGLTPKGVCPDFLGNVWAANMGSSNVTIIDPGGGVLGTAAVQSWNYTYSDFTGYGLATFAAMVGYVFRDYNSADICGGPSMRERVYFTATFPNPGAINFHARSSDTEAGLATAPETWLGTVDEPTGSVPIRGPMSAADASRQYFRLRIELLRGGAESPILHDYTIEEYCL